MGAQINIIVGATASGKSALALARAQQCDSAVIINADALQLYEELQILSARPLPQEMAGIPHRLFGVLNHNTKSSAGRWLQMVGAEIDRALAEEAAIFVVGGTGLYVKALIEGLSPIPEVPEELVQHLTWDKDKDSLYPLLLERDPQMAERLEPGDRQRIIRALAVLEHTGKSISYWQSLPKQPPYPREMLHITRVEMERQALYARCDARFAAMMKAGALAEVQNLRKLNIPADHILMKAVGVAELTAYLHGELTLDQAVAKAQQHTRNYAKRQLTWLRHQLPANEVTSVG